MGGQIQIQGDDTQHRFLKLRSPKCMSNQLSRLSLVNEFVDLMIDSDIESNFRKKPSLAQCSVLPLIKNFSASSSDGLGKGETIDLPSVTMAAWN